MTKAELRSRVRQLLGGQTDVTLDDDWYDTCVLDGYRYLLTYQGSSKAPAMRAPQMRTLRFLEHEDRLERTLDTSLTSNFVANQSGVLAMLDIYDRTNDKGLTLDPPRSILLRNPDDMGIPQVWSPGALAGVNGYYIWPTPGVSGEEIDIYERVVKDPVLGSDSSEPLVGREWHMAIAYAGAAQGAGLLDWPEKEQELLGKFENHIASRTTRAAFTARGGKTGRRRNVSVGW